MLSVPEELTLPSPPELVEAAVAPARRRGKLLVVDDDDGPRLSLELLFKDEYEVLLAAEGASAIALAREHDIDVAILDIRMPGMSGIEVLERLKYVSPRMEVVMMTAFETTDTIRQALRLRACDYVNKPFDLATIRSAVAGAMRRRTLEGEINTNAEKLQALMTELQDQKVEEQMAHTRGEIYASIIHDMNNPLAVISGSIQMMSHRIGASTRLETADLDYIRERLKLITRQVTNCVEISRRYLSFLRQKTGDAPKVGVNQLLSDLSHLIQAHPTRQNHQFEVSPLAEDIAVRMNGTDFIQVLLNLTTNAFQCCAHTHSVEVEARVLREPLELRAFRDGPQDRFLNVEGFQNTAPLLAAMVRDTGPGIPPEVVPKIFQAYFSTKGEKQGTGLGLNIVQRLVKEAKGALHLRTVTGQGTAFTVYLPAVPVAT
ncbi:MAG: hybrid sensor histidine kinase/response regulator [Verrucomicrobia bacterium]|nr:MAG: hybrid sensor histidine kinase/response regulator [Verrucomicrobiota bacterium]